MRAMTTTLVGLALLGQLVGTRVEAQSVTERSPNLGGTWLAEARAVHFNFVHRFNTSPPPQRTTLCPGDLYDRRFDEPGTYPYACEPHPFMTATVIVE